MHGRRAALHRHHRAHLRPDPAPGAGRLQGRCGCGAATATIARAAIAATFDRRWVHDGDAWRVALPCVRAAGPCRVAAGTTALARSDRDGAAPWCDPWSSAWHQQRPIRRDCDPDAAADEAWCGQRAVASPCTAARWRPGRAHARLDGGTARCARAHARPAHPDVGSAPARSARGPGRCTARRRAVGTALCRCESDADL